MINVFEVIANIFTPTLKFIDSLHTSEEEKLNLKNEFSTIQNSMACKLLDYELEIMRYQAKAIENESKNGSWLQRNWRPITMITFLILVSMDCIGLLHYRLAKEAWFLLQIGLGGYVTGRSVEKVVKMIKDK